MVLRSIALPAVVAALPVSQIHLSHTNIVQNCTNGVAVSFASEQAEPFTVGFGIEGENCWCTAESTSDTYTVANGPYKYTSPYLHTAYLCNLQPLKTYVYSIDTKSYSFFTPPRPGSTDGPTVFGVVGDPGDTSDSSTTLKNLGQAYHGLSIQALLIAGDYSYANGEHAVWDNWYVSTSTALTDDRRYAGQEQVFARVPQLGINGNHETITYGGHSYNSPFGGYFVDEDYLGYLKRTVSPISAQAKAAKRTYYSFDLGLVHLVFLDDYVGSKGHAVNPVGSTAWLHERELQLSWLADDLSRVNRTHTPWVIVVKHNPYYNTWNDHQCQCSKAHFEIHDVDACWRGQYVSGSPMYEPACGLQAKFEPLFVKYGVNAVMSGHVHGYERTAPIVSNAINAKKGVVYFTVGAGGNYEGHAGPRLQGKLPGWSLKVNNEIYGAAKVIATRDALQVLWFANSNATEPWDAVTLFPRK
ncbi:unnamed protein product [Aphanomyces euteiches]